MKLTSLSEQLQAHNIIVERNYEEVLEIVHKRKEPASGKRHTLKAHVVITTEELLKKLEDAEKVPQERKKRKVNKNAKKASGPSINQSVKSPISLEQIVFYSNENMELIMSKQVVEYV